MAHSIKRGLYQIKQYNPEKRLDHYAVLDAGNILRLAPEDFPFPLIYDLSPEGIQWRPLYEGETWEVLLEVHPQNYPAAIQRAQEAIQQPEYHVAANNCEQFSRYITEGEKYSTQVQNVTVAITSVAFIGFLLKK